MLYSLLSDTATLEWDGLIICISASLILGLLVAGVHMVKNVYTKNFVITLAVLPVLVQSVIMLVNGNLGTGVAIPLPFRSRRFSRNHQCVLVHGDRLSYRYGLCRLCGGFFIRGSCLFIDAVYRTLWRTT